MRCDKRSTKSCSARERLRSVVRGPDGKLVVAGSADNGQTDFALVRYNSDGSLDTAFGAGGKVTTDFAAHDDVAVGVAVQADASAITTIEGLAPNGHLHPLQEGFWEEHGLQCGYCTPGMIMAAVTLLQDNPRPSEREIREGISGNFCRCTGYQHIVNAIQHAANKR